MLAKCGQRMQRSWASVLTRSLVRTERAARFALERIAMYLAGHEVKRVAVRGDHVRHGEEG